MPLSSAPTTMTNPTLSGMVQNTNHADDATNGQQEVIVLLPRLPDHFAATFAYAEESSAGPSRRSRDSLSEPNFVAGPHDFEPRRSSRTRQVHIPNLDAYDEDDGDSAQEKLSSVGRRSVKSRARTTKSVTSDDDSDPSSTKPKQSKKPRKRIKRTRDDPNSATGSIYAHLKGLPDLFAENNDIMFCGINPGVKSSSSGHHFAHRSNHFYPSIHLAGITELRMKPEQDVDFPHLTPFSLGLTNLAGRPTAEGAELLPNELIAGVPLLLDKVRKWKPKTVCFVGKGISEAFMKGLKQAGAIKTQGKMKRNTSFDLSQSQGVEPRKAIKKEPGLNLPTKAEPDEDKLHPVLMADIPSSVLLASPTSTFEDRNTSPKPPSSPQKKAKKVIYTKGNSKDDAGYGLLPICVPHSGYQGPAGSVTSLRDVTLFFVTPSSSARVTTHFLEDKARILSSLRELVQHLGSAHALELPSSSRVTHRIKKEEEDDALFTGGASAIQAPSGAMQTVKLEVVDVSPFGL